ncbi:hypothetical protein ILYODFUR_019105 [Ilyodon furcidens]|uniref:Uncharacterized protein n=1 Tax=Ilyodon furcidens TaxID=33524 RepID=A0ABV0SMI7_9TELE
MSLLYKNTKALFIEFLLSRKYSPRHILKLASKICSYSVLKVQTPNYILTRPEIFVPYSPKVARGLTESELSRIYLQMKWILPLSCSRCLLFQGSPSLYPSRGY